MMFRDWRFLAYLLLAIAAGEVIQVAHGAWWNLIGWFAIGWAVAGAYNSGARS